MPPVAAGNDLRFMKRALEVALQSEDPHTKVSTNYLYCTMLDFDIRRACNLVHRTHSGCYFQNRLGQSW